MFNMLTMEIVFNNYLFGETTMELVLLLHEKTSATFFPRIIREFEDGPDEKPMIYYAE